MLSPLLPCAADLDRWADEYATAAQLPRLVRRLIAATSAFTQLEFPADDAVRFAGWDGVASVTNGPAWVPIGVSGWELGCEARARITRKATSDYDKRTSDPLALTQSDSTFVFVTPRTWPGKDHWLAERSASPWQGVRALDATDLETWLESATAVHLWLAEIMDHRLDGVGTLEAFWKEWARVSTPLITPAFLLAGREEQAGSVTQWLTAESGSFAIRADSPDEARAFVAAVADQGGGDDPLANVLVVSDSGTWRRLLLLPGQRFVLVPDFDEADVNGAVAAGHCVIHALGPDQPFGGTALELPRLDREKVSAALVEMGMTDVDAKRLAGEAWRSLPAFRRQHAVNQQIRRPAWATPAGAHVLIPAMLVGSWDRLSPGDKTVISELCGGRPYEDIEAELHVLATRADPPLRRIGQTWSVASKIDLWTQLSGMAHPSVWPTFERLAVEVTCERDPAWELPPDAPLIEVTRRHDRVRSDRLRHGLADSVALLGSAPPTPLLSDGRSAPAVAAAIVREATDRANADASGANWAALSDSLLSLAEASPETFVRSVERGLRGPAPILRLIPDSQRQFSLFGRQFDYRPVASALAMLAWDPALLAAVGMALATFARLAPKDERRPSPDDDLVRVLLPWYPQTAASVEQQLDLLTRLQDREPDVAWNVLLKLVPNAVQATTDTPHPRYRAWRADGPRSISGIEWRRLVEGICSRLVQQAVAEPGRLPKLIENYGDLAPSAQNDLREELLRLDLSASGVDQTAIADAIREQVARHRAHDTAVWAMPAEAVDELDNLLRALEPNDPIERAKWLFDDHPDMETVSGGDYHNYDERLQHLRLQALTQILAEQGVGGIEVLLGGSQSPRAVGLGLGRLEAVADCDILQWSRSDDERKRQAARFFFASRVNLKGDEWATSVLVETCPLAPEIAGLLLATPAPPRRSLWGIAERIGPDAADAYWREFYGFPETIEEAAEAAGQLIDRGHPYAAIDVLGMEAHKKRKLDPDLVTRALRLAAVTPPPRQINSGSLGYDVSQLLGALESDGVDEDEIATLEWLFLPLLDHGERQPRALHAKLASHPEFFVEVLSVIYRADDEDVREGTAEDVARAERAWQLLSDWRTPPGVGRDGAVDPDALVTWVRRARDLAASAKRSAPADSKIGAILRHVPTGEDGFWPHEVVRQLLEEVQSEELETGIAIEVVNSRGVTTRGPLDGGSQERVLASGYAEAAQALLPNWPRAAAVLTMLAAGFDEDAKRHDVDAKIREEDWS